MCGNWVVTCPYHPAPGFRELELAFEEPGRERVKFLRLYEDGRLEVGERHSEFQAEYRWEASRD